MLGFLFLFIFGAFCGSRTIVPTAVLSWYIHLYPEYFGGVLCLLLAKSAVVALLTLAAVAELIVDKLSITPSRLKAPLLIGRLCAGAFVAYALVSCIERAAPDMPYIKVALIGTVGALCGALVGYFLRTRIPRWTKLPDWPVALTEDAIVIGGTILLLNLITIAC